MHSGRNIRLRRYDEGRVIYLRISQIPANELELLFVWLENGLKSWSCSIACLALCYQLAMDSDIICDRVALSVLTSAVTRYTLVNTSARCPLRQNLMGNLLWLLPEEGDLKTYLRDVKHVASLGRSLD